jgi:hypothetical protein
VMDLLRATANRLSACGRALPALVRSSWCPKANVHIRADRRRVGFEDASDHDPVCKHVVIVIVPFAGWVRPA